MSDPVIIVGAGLSGLALAQGLHMRNIPFRLFERDEHLAARDQGYRVRVSNDGVEALKSVLSVHHFEKFQQCCALGVSTAAGNNPVVIDALTAETGQPFFPTALDAKAPVGHEQTVLSIDRGTARRVLVQGIEDRVSFAKEFQSFEEYVGGVTVVFKNGEKVRGCALIASDGSMSTVRRQLHPRHSILDSEGRLIFGKTVLSHEMLNACSPELASGLFIIRSSDRLCIAESMRFDHFYPETPPDYIYWALYLRKDECMPDSQLMSLSTEEVLQLAQQLAEGWHESIRALFDARFAKTGVYRIATGTPTEIPCKTSSESHVVLIGDASHPMAPSAALGATTALTDVKTLLRCIDQQKSSTAFPAAFEEYETEMRVYATSALEKSQAGGRTIFSMKPFDQLPVVSI